ncbi:MAG TPA: tetratricopeptide repeat protein [Phycisphaerae bacterium]|nr:tetratricopeptide repeat protein [Phycisphaerae bacterium]
MYTQSTQSYRETAWPVLWRRAAISILTIVLAGDAGWARSPDVEDPVERSMTFIDKTMDATKLANDNRTKEALALFEKLAADYGDLDEDGYVAMAIGDCLAALKRYREARTAYQNAAEAHPQLADSVRQRVVELELAGEVGEALVEDLRVATADQDEATAGARWRLGRALQKRAKSTLIEAATAFRLAASVEPTQVSLCRPHAMRRQAAMLEELAEDLGALIDQTEDEWGWVRQLIAGGPPRGSAKPARPDLVVQARHCEYTVQTREDPPIKLEITQDKDDCTMRCAADGRPMVLTETQKLLIRRHEARISAILLEAVEQDKAGPEGSP